MDVGVTDVDLPEWLRITEIIKVTQAFSSNILVRCRINDQECLVEIGIDEAKRLWHDMNFFIGDY